MPKQKKWTLNQISKYLLITLGIMIVVVSAFSGSSFLAILGTAVAFWGAILFYLTPVKHLPLTLAESMANCNNQNIERVLSDFGSAEKGIYLPPKNLDNSESSLIFISGKSQTPSTPIADVTSPHPNKDGLFITPSGFELSQLFEKELNTSFTRLDLKQFADALPKLLVDNLEVAKTIELSYSGNTVSAIITDTVFESICKKTSVDYPHIHTQMGCLFSSAIACALAKVTGKPVIIQNETVNQENKTITIEYQMINDVDFVIPKVIPNAPLTLSPLPELTSTAVSQPPEVSPPPQESIEIPESEDLSALPAENADSQPTAFEINVPSDSLTHFKKSGDTVLLVPAEIPQSPSYRIEGYTDGGDVTVGFLEFVEVCKTSESTLESDVASVEYITKIFDPSSPATSKDYDLTFYLTKSGFKTVADWLGEIKVTDIIPECATGHRKLFLIYNIQKPTTN
ncbi:MAG: hypothetical protein NWE92_10895 [Candidatus Bathyarchaeota archaeon]|nr:hypothetical protein [Candidatus Bathyarchaeota archaeon]